MKMDELISYNDRLDHLIEKSFTREWAERCHKILMVFYVYILPPLFPKGAHASNLVLALTVKRVTPCSEQQKIGGSRRSVVVPSSFYPPG
jgi:hypothetical protein